jgi:hypothetical protein
MNPQIFHKNHFGASARTNRCNPRGADLYLTVWMLSGTQCAPPDAWQM